MKFTCDKQAFVKSLNIVSKAVTSRTTIPILKGILIKCESDNGLKLSSSDLEISIETEVEAIVESKGSIVVSAKLFNDIVRKLPEGIVKVDVNEDGMINIISGHSEFTLQGLSEEDFPKITDEKEGIDLVFDKETFKNMIKGTCYAASIDESRGIITGVLMEIKRDMMTMVALDGFRMAIMREKVTNENEMDLVISARIMNEIGKILGEQEDDEEINITIDDKKAIFSLEKTKIVARLMEGDFIKYNDILPQNNRIKLSINKNDLMDGVDRCSIIVREGKNSFIRLKMEDDNLLITSRSEEGSTKEEIKIEKEGENIEIGFNAKYMGETLRAINDTDIVMEFNTSISPCLVKPLNGSKYEYLILPVRLSTGNI
jgi:DNA polymerase-3 subunit beta